MRENGIKHVVATVEFTWASRFSSPNVSRLEYFRTYAYGLGPERDPVALKVLQRGEADALLRTAAVTEAEDIVPQLLPRFPKAKLNSLLELPRGSLEVRVYDEPCLPVVYSLPLVEGLNVPALVAAAAQSDVQRVKALLESGLDINMKDKDGMPALMWAANIPSSSQALRALLDVGADVNVQDSRGSSALMAAAEADDWEKVDLLLKRGASVNTKNRDGWTALMLASKSTSPSTRTTQLLLEAGASVKAKTLRGLTALMVASSSCNVSAAEALIEAGADPSEKDLAGKTALDYVPQGCLAGLTPPNKLLEMFKHASPAQK